MKGIFSAGHMDKRQLGSSSKNQSKTTAVGNEENEAFNEEQCKVTEQCVVGAASGMGQAVERELTKQNNQINEVTTKADAQEAKLQQFEVQMTEVEALEITVEALRGQSSDTAAIKAEMTRVEKQLDRKRSDPESPPSNSEPTKKIPLEQRLLARMGNLAWDAAATEILARAKSVLSEAGIEESQYSGLCAPRRTGSGAELCFNSSEVLQKAKLLVNSLNKVYRDQEPVWLKWKRSQDEMSAACIVHRAADFL